MSPISCSLISSNEKQEETGEKSQNNAFSPSSLMGGFGGSDSYIPGGLTGQSAPKAEEVASLTQFEDKQKKEGIIFTDPDNPNAQIEELDQALEHKSQNDWLTQYNVAKKEAIRQQRPLLIWFTNPSLSPNTVALNDELFSKKGFLDWAVDNIIRLRIDMSDSNFTGRRKHDKRKAMQNILDKYGVTSFPTLIILTADGQVVDKIKGYRSGYFDDTYDQIRNDCTIAYKNFLDTKKYLIQQGYREWTGLNGTVILAKLVKYIEPATLLLREADGTSTKTKLRQLSDADKSYIEKLKKKYGKDVS